MYTIVATEQITVRQINLAFIFHGEKISFNEQRVDRVQNEGLSLKSGETIGIYFNFYYLQPSSIFLLHHGVSY